MNASCALWEQFLQRTAESRCVERFDNGVVHSGVGQAARPAESLAKVSRPTMRSRSPAATPRDCSHARIALHVSWPFSSAICHKRCLQGKHDNMRRTNNVHRNVITDNK
eukprot:6186916-Pleurochrysis_carterae.AAC.2